VVTASNSVCLANLKIGAVPSSRSTSTLQVNILGIRDSGLGVLGSRSQSHVPRLAGSCVYIGVSPYILLPPRPLLTWTSALSVEAYRLEIFVRRGSRKI
jgi:hypothetical protein